MNNQDKRNLKFKNLSNLKILVHLITKSEQNKIITWKR